MYPEFHKTIREMGDEACAAAIIEGTVSHFEDESLIKIGIDALNGCSLLTEIKTPATKEVLPSAVRKTGVSTVLLRNRAIIHSTAFENCTNLTALILCGNWTTSLMATNALNGTPIKEGSGYIYVPKKMANGSDGIAAYEAATNWSVFAGQFRYIEDFPEILAKVKEVAPWY